MELMDLNELFTYNDPEKAKSKALELAKERLRDFYSKLPKEEQEQVEEGLFMEFLGELENKINAMIQTAKVAGFKIEDGGFNKIANRCFKQIIETKERQDTQPGEKEFMVMFVKAIGNVLNDTYEIKKIYFED